MKQAKSNIDAAGKPFETAFCHDLSLIEILCFILNNNQLLTYFTEQHKQPFLNSSHSSNSSPPCPTDIDFSIESPKN